MTRYIRLQLSLDVANSVDSNMRKKKHEEIGRGIVMGLKEQMNQMWKVKSKVG